jgi:hypothetical protein
MPQQADSSGLQLILRRRTSRPQDIEPATDRLQCGLGHTGANAVTCAVISQCEVSKRTMEERNAAG